MNEAAVDPVLTMPPPSFTERAEALGLELFGVEGTAVSVASERDQTFLIDGSRPAVLKISNAAEDRLDSTWRHWRPSEWSRSTMTCRLLCRGSFRGTDACRAPISRDGDTHCSAHVRPTARPSVQYWRRGPQRSGGSRLGDDGGARRPDAERLLAPGGGAGDALGCPTRHPTTPDGPFRGGSGGSRGLIEAALDRYEQVVTPVWPSLRAQFIHTDLCASNILVDDAGAGDGDRRLW